jgi:hypothetical protein
MMDELAVSWWEVQAPYREVVQEAEAEKDHQKMLWPT